MTDNTCDGLNLAGLSPDKRKHSGDQNNSSKNDQSMIKTSNLYCQKENPPYMGSVKHTSNLLSVSSIDILSSVEQEVKTCSKTEIKSKSISFSPAKTPISANKPIRNVFDKHCSVLFTDKANSKSCTKKVSVGKICVKTSPKAKDRMARKRCSLGITGDGINPARSCKKARFDENMNTKDLEDCEMQKEKCQDSISGQSPEIDKDITGLVPDVSKMSRTSDSLNTCTKENITTVVESDEIKYGPCAEREPLNMECSKSSLGIKSKNAQTLNVKEKDSGFQETFHILEEFSDVQSPSLCSSPDLFTRVSSCGSSGVFSSSNSRTCSSPDLQNSITKYFTPVRGAGETSPSADRTGKRNLKARKDVSPSSSPVSGKMEQMYLDLGQKDFGHVTCQTCNMVYTRAQPEDEADHLKFHRKFVTGLRFLGWKTERVVEQCDDGRVIVVLPHDHSTHQKKVADVRRVVDNELGFSSETSLRMQDSQTYMFITNKKVVGCIVAVGIQKAYPMLPLSTEDQRKPNVFPGAWCCSSTPVRAQCGISRIWVLQQYRRKGIATRLLECVRNHFMFGCVIAKESLAFSDPTPLGKRLAESYSGTESFLVFR